MKQRWIISGFLWIAVVLFGFVIAAPARADDGAALSPEEQLGKLLFFDQNLSTNRTQSCATCHAPEVGYTGPDSGVNATTVVYPAALGDRYGNRKPPSAAYAGDSPALHYDEAAGEWVGGMFWDGRATGAVLGDPLAEQAGGPFLNPLEQGMPNKKLVCLRARESGYADLFTQVWGKGSLDCVKDVEGTYERIVRSIAAYERSAEVNPFSSKFDLFWDNAQAANKDVTQIRYGNMRDPYRWQNYRNLGLTDEELQGLAAFNDPNRANCASCHSLTPGSAGYPLFTSFTYDNIGMPRNPDNPFYLMPDPWNPDGDSWVDEGLGGYLKSAGYPPEVYEPQLGKFKVPTLRNVDLRSGDETVKAYGHNGYFKSLDDLIHFYAWRGMMDGGMNCDGMGGGGMGGGGMGGGGMGGGIGGCEGMETLFPAPEVDQNLAPMQMFNMMDRTRIVAFLKTLSDGYIP